MAKCYFLVLYPDWMDTVMFCAVLLFQIHNLIITSKCYNISSSVSCVKSPDHEASILAKS
jgi:hypothetical protein